MSASISSYRTAAAGRPHPVRGWPPLLVVLVAVALTGLGLVGSPPLSDGQWGMLAVVALLAVIHTEASARVQRTCRFLDRSVLAVGADASAFWTFAGAVVLPGAYAAVMAVAVVLYGWARAGRTEPFRRPVYRAAAVALGCLAAAAVTELLGSGPSPAGAAGGPMQELGAPLRELGVLVLAMLVFLVVTRSLSTADAADSPRGRLVALLASWDDDSVLEVGVLCLAGLTAVVLSVSPPAALFVLVPLVVLLRAALIRPLVTAARTDGKTGLLNSAAWHAEADRVLATGPARRIGGGVLVLDLDHFKAVNDAHGHVVGDQVLAAVAGVLRDGVRAQDVVGRLGGEEFVVAPLVASFRTRAVELEVVAERVRARVAALHVPVAAADGPRVVRGLTVSIGVAVVPAAGTDLVTLLRTADAALYVAKRAGRDRVCIQVAPPRADAPTGPSDGPDTSTAQRRIGTLSSQPVTQVHPHVRPPSS